MKTKIKTPSYIIPKISRKHWDKIGFIKRIGTAVPVFSLKSNKCLDLGIGDFETLKELINTCYEYNLDIIQLLPINETSPHDNSPFGSISAFAINPLFMDISKLFSDIRLGDPKQIIENDPELIDLFETVQQSVHVDYNNARKLKRSLMEYAFHKFWEAGDSETHSQFQKYCKKNRIWLDGYCVFKYLKEKHNWIAIYDWQKKWQKYSDNLYILLEQEHSKELKYHAFVQWVLFEQCQNIHDYAKSKNILIKGDIPLLVSKESADYWMHPKLFKKGLKAGAPPDFYARDGQDWGLPVYNWPQHKKEDYSWWKKRLNYSENFFDLYRIDHVLGLFRIWAIPEGKKGSEGDYLPKDESKWKSHGTNLLKMMLLSSSMLPIAEDLGTVPKSVRETLEGLGIPGYKFMIMEHKIPPQVFSPISLIATSTHDSPTLQGMWEALSEEEKNNYCFINALEIEDKSFNDYTHKILLNKMLMGTKSMFLAFPLQDILGKIPGIIGDNPEQDRVNTPATIGGHNWSYRLPDLENPQVKNKLASFAQQSKNSKEEFATFYIKNNKKINETIDIDSIRNNKQLEIDAKKNLIITSRTSGMARVISDYDVTDIPFIQTKNNNYEIKIKSPNIDQQINVTFFWRIDPNTHQWEEQDYQINFKVKGQATLPF